MWSPQTRRLIEIAADEDLGDRDDITAALLPDAGGEVITRVVPRHPGVICGLALGPSIAEVFARRLAQPLEFSTLSKDGDHVGAGICVATLRGPRAAVLSVERTLLNFLGRLSGVATLTRRYVDVARAVNPGAQILDTRKTIPGWRELDKYAVRAGGGQNHRAGLYDAVLIKDNHLAGIPVEQLAARLVELLQLSEVCKVPAVGLVLLDNFTPEQMRAAVALRDARRLRGKLVLEASGGVTLETVGPIAATGVDRISIGALTHSAASLDIGLDL
jgi:nicotinate-nucleotide pyrophosphorylase (carboxylating)